MCMNRPYPAPEHGSAEFCSAPESKIITGSGDHGPQGCGALCIRIPSELPLLNISNQRERKGFQRPDNSPTSPSQSNATASSSLALHAVPPAKYLMACNVSRLAVGITAKYTALARYRPLPNSQSTCVPIGRLSIVAAAASIALCSIETLINFLLENWPRFSKL